MNTFTLLNVLLEIWKIHWHTAMDLESSAIPTTMCEHLGEKQMIRAKNEKSTKKSSHSIEKSSKRLVLTSKCR